MARGTANGEGVSSVQQAVDAKAFGDNFDQTFGARDESRGRWILDPKTGKLVRPWEYVAEESEQARFAPISVDRHYENVPSPIDGTVFRSRRHHKEYMKAHGLTTTDDFDKKGGAWERAEAQRKAGLASTPEARRLRQEQIGRRLYEVEKMSQGQYDREVREIARRRAARGTAEPTSE